MNPQDWQLIQDVFHRALALPAGEREAFVRDSLETPDLQQEVLDLLAAEQGEDGILGATAALPTDETLQTGSMVGNYRIESKIGEGGMGLVYLAQRADGTFEKDVALKVVSKGMNTAAIVSRFEQERSILARLEHPNIAGVLDGGMTDDGRPYLVMEYVDGIPLTDYCDEHSLSISARLQIFHQVCQAVQYAHQSLVVHRDLKPSNILVTPAGVPKLLDFGIAKILEQEDDPLLTQTGVMLATPAYAAPEQLTGGNITTMTDVYALGVLLYELMTGRRPYESQRTPDEYRALILNSDPMRPSTAVTQQPGADREQTTRLETIAAARRAQVTRLRSIIRGDLDNICLMAIMREPNMRYATAAALGEDIARHLDGKPVSARRQSLAYRARKFYNRHRAGVLAGTVAAVLAIGFGFYHTISITKERDLALQEQAKTAEVVDFVTGLFLAADPAQSRGEEITARELLDAGLRQIDTEMNGRPELQSTMRQVLGGVAYQLGMHEQALKLLYGALGQQQALYGEYHREPARTLLQLGMQEQSLGNVETARQQFNQAADIYQRLGAERSIDMLEIISAQAFLEETEGNYDRAEALHDQALSLARGLAPRGEDIWVAQMMAKKASLLRLQDRLEEAETLLRDALTLQNKLWNGAHPESDETKRQFAELLTDRRKFDEAEVLFKELIDSREKMLGPDHYETGSAWNSYGHLLSAKGDTAGAVDAYNRMLTITRNAYGDTHPSLAAGYNNVAILERNQGNLQAALEGFELSLQMQIASGFAADHPLRAYPISGRGRIYLLMRRYAEAAADFETAMALRLPQLGETHILVIEMKADLGAAYTELGRYDEAEPLLLSAHQHLVDNWPESDPRIGLVAARLLRLYSLTNEPARAAAYENTATPQAEDTMLQYY